MRLPIGAITATASPTLALTFDDGPDPSLTPQLLEVLDRHQVRATFFVLLTKAARHPDVLDAVVDAGHEIALHGPDHAPVIGLGFRSVHERLSSAKRDLEARSGQTVRWYRPPYGSQTAVSYLAAARAGLTTVLWSATTWDWKPVTQAQRIDKVDEGARRGAILLAHDGIIGADDGAAPEPSSACDRVDLIDGVLAGFAERSLAVGTLGDALAHGRPDKTLRFVVRPSRPQSY